MIQRKSKKIGCVVGKMVCVEFIGNKKYLFDCSCGSRNVVRTEAVFMRSSDPMASCGCTTRRGRVKADKPVVSEPAKKVHKCGDCKHDVSNEEFMKGILCRVEPKTDKDGDCISWEKQVENERRF